MNSWGVTLGSALLVSITAFPQSNASSIRIETPPGVETVATVTVRNVTSGVMEPPSEVAIPGILEIPAEGGPWQIRVDAPNLFPSEVTLSQNETGKLVVLRRAGWIGGKLTRSGPGETGPDGMRASFEGAGKVKEQYSPSWSECEIDGDAWRCPVPEGRLDVRVGSRGFIPHYRWGVRIEAAKETNLGALPLIRGASVSGTVELAPDVPPSELERVRVRLIPRMAQRAPEDSDARLAQRSQVVAVNSDGFYQFTNVPPGEFEIRGGHPSLGSSRLQFTVKEGMETQIRQPLLFAPLDTVTFRVAPRAAPNGESWRVHIRSSSQSGERQSAEAGPDGEAVLKNIVAGIYRIEVRSSSGGELWWSDEIHLSSGPVEITVPLLLVKGTLMLGEEPVQASLSFSRGRGTPSVSVRSDAKGKFSDFIAGSDAQSWHVRVEAKDPVIRTALREVVPSIRNEAMAIFDIVLPTTELRGKVVDEQGAPVSRALVTLAHEGLNEIAVQMPVREDGTFSLVGIEEGDYRLQAAAGAKSSVAERVTLKEESEQEVTLLLATDPILTGRVLGAPGALVGAAVGIVPTDVEALVNPLVTTDAGVHFQRLIHRGAREFDLAVFAPGHPFRSFHVVGTDPLEIQMWQPGGTVVFEIASSALSGNPAQPQAWFVHRGAVHPVRLLASRWRGQWTGSEERGALRVAEMEPGEYALCLGTEAEVRVLRAMPASRCSRGVLAPFGTLELSR